MYVLCVCVVVWMDIHMWEDRLPSARDVLASHSNYARNARSTK